MIFEAEATSCDQDGCEVRYILVAVRSYTVQLIVNRAPSWQVGNHINNSHVRWAHDTFVRP